jgi:hypothetical protein
VGSIATYVYERRKYDIHDSIVISKNAKFSGKRPYNAPPNSMKTNAQN